MATNGGVLAGLDSPERIISGFEACLPVQAQLVLPAEALWGSESRAADGDLQVALRGQKSDFSVRVKRDAQPEASSTGSTVLLTVDQVGPRAGVLAGILQT